MGPKQHHPNSRQLPIFILNNELSESTASHKDKNESFDFDMLNAYSLSPFDNSESDIARSENFNSLTSLTQARVCATAYPSMLVKCKLDILDLSLLVSLEIGRYTGERLLRNPQNLVSFLGGKNWSFCRYIPHHYSQSDLVRKATDCVLARVRCLLSPKQAEWEPLAISSYSEALSVLQEAINSTSQVPSADVLCATQMLGVYEVR
jgi:hypothetical protein